MGTMSVPGGGVRAVRLLGTGRAVPNVLCFDTNQGDTLGYFLSMRNRTRVRMRGVRSFPVSTRRSKIATVRNWTDFKNIRRISAGAALVLAAEHDRSARLSGRNVATINLGTWDRYVATTLSRLGFFDLLNLADYEDETSDAILIERMVAQAAGDVRPGTSAIRSLFAKVKGSNQIRVALGSALTDAVENVVGHAYPESWVERSMRVPFWWFVGAADPIRSRVTLVIYDQGITIPASLPLKWSERDLLAACQRLFNLPYRSDIGFDGRAIDAAMAIGATSTEAAHRGKGLPKIRELVTQCPNGRLRIISRHGECLYTAGTEKVVRVLPVPLNGTYIELDASFA